MTRRSRKDREPLRTRAFFANTIPHFLRVIFSFFLIGLFVHPASAKQKSNKKATKSLPCTPKPQTASQTPESELQDEKVQADMEKHLGVPYRWGGNGSSGFDCSGFVRHVYNEIFGIDLPRQSSAQNRLSTLEDVSFQGFDMGDLLFFSSQRSKKRIDHVGIYLSDGNFIHSARSRGVVISSLNSQYWKSKLAATKRVIKQDTRMEFSGGEPGFGFADDLGERNLFKFPPAHRGLDLSRLSLAQGGSPSLLDNDESYSMEIDLVRLRYADAWAARLTGFLDNSYEGQDNSFFFPSASRQPVDSSGISSLSGNARGLQITSEIRANKWLSVSPSLIYFDYGSGVDPSNRPKVAFGTGLSIGSASEGWSLSTGFQYALLRYSSATLSDSPNSSTPNLYLSYNQWLANHVQFSVSGELSLKDFQGWGTPVFTRAGTEHGRLCFAFNFFF